MALCDILSSGIFQIWICLAILAYFIQSCLAKQTKTRRQNLQVKWNAVGKVEGHFNPGLFNPKLQPQTFQPRTFQP